MFSKKNVHPNDVQQTFFYLKILDHHPHHHCLIKNFLHSEVNLAGVHLTCTKAMQNSLQESLKEFYR